MSTAPDGEIEEITELLPTEKVMEDLENIDITTEKMSLKPYRLCIELFNYLRSVLSEAYKENDGADSEYLMISCPRVLPFELFICERAIELIEKVGEI